MTEEVEKLKTALEKDDWRGFWRLLDFKEVIELADAFHLGKVYELYGYYTLAVKNIEIYNCKELLNVLQAESYEEIPTINTTLIPKEIKSFLGIIMKVGIETAHKMSNECTGTNIILLDLFKDFERRFENVQNCLK